MGDQRRDIGSMVSPKASDGGGKVEEETVSEARARIDKLWRTASAAGKNINFVESAGVKPESQSQLRGGKISGTLRGNWGIGTASTGEMELEYANLCPVITECAIAKTEPSAMLLPVAEDLIHEGGRDKDSPLSASAGAHAYGPSLKVTEERLSVNAFPARPTPNHAPSFGGSSSGLNLINLNRLVTEANAPSASETWHQLRLDDNVGELLGSTSTWHSTPRSSQILTSIAASVEDAVQHPCPASGTSRRQSSDVNYNEKLEEEAALHEETQASGDDHLKAAIAEHPLYPTMVLAHIRILKIGAPSRLQAKLDDIAKKFHSLELLAPESSKLGLDPELDNFMRAYTELLTRFREDLEEPYNKMMQFMDSAAKDLEDICGHYVDTKPPEEEENYGYDVVPSAGGMDGSKAKCVEVEDEWSGAQDTDQAQQLVDQANELLTLSPARPGDVDQSIVVDPDAPEDELKKALMKKYGRHIGGLKAEFNRVRKKGKLPSGARHILKNWFNHHSYWPYPSEVEKAYLQRLCNLDLKQVNNWFINERKRHWSSEEKCLQDPNVVYYDLRAANPESACELATGQHYQQEQM